MSAPETRRFRTEGGAVLELTVPLCRDLADQQRRGELLELPPVVVEPAPASAGTEGDPGAEDEGSDDGGTPAAPAVEPVAVPMPALTDDKGDWVAYAVARGMTASKARGMSRPELHAHFTATPPAASSPAS